MSPPVDAVGERPLCVDLDGTLLRIDTLHERLLALLLHQPWEAWRLPFWLLKGKAHFKCQLARRTHLAFATLPVSEEFLQFLRAEHAHGRKLILVTGSDAETARRIAERFPIFSEVLATEGEINLIGSRKQARLVEKFGVKGFDYAGNSGVDVPIWRAAKECIIVNAGAGLQGHVRREAESIRVFGGRTEWFGLLRRVLRVHQWPKNVLLLVPVITGHKLGEPLVLKQIALGIVAFCLCASSVYILNDLHDLEADRLHRTKRNRPFAAGEISVAAGLMLAPLLLVLAFLSSLWLPQPFLAYLGTYCVGAALYSWWLKRVVMLDVLLLAGLYTLRILAGHGATGIAYSSWLLGFSLFSFLSLALLKRYIELHRLDPAQGGDVAGRGYRAEDLRVVPSMGLASGYVGALVLALYINSREVMELYTRPLLLLFICPLLLYWISRAWLLATRDQLDDDPVLFALRDKTSYLVGAMAALFIWLATVR